MICKSQTVTCKYISKIYYSSGNAQIYEFIYIYKTSGYIDHIVDQSCSWHIFVGLRGYVLYIYIKLMSNDKAMIYII